MQGIFVDKLRYGYVLPYPGMYHQLGVPLLIDTLVEMSTICSRLYAFIIMLSLSSFLFSITLPHITFILPQSSSSTDE